MHGDVHGLLFRVTYGIDAVNGAALDRKADRAEEDRLCLPSRHDGHLVGSNRNHQLQRLAVGDIREQHLVVHPDIGWRHGRNVRNHERSLALGHLHIVVLVHRHQRIA